MNYFVQSTEQSLELWNYGRGSVDKRQQIKVVKENIRSIQNSITRKWKPAVNGVTDFVICHLCALGERRVALGISESMCCLCPIKIQVNAYGCKRTSYYKWDKAVVNNKPELAVRYAKDMLQLLQTLLIEEKEKLRVLEGKEI